MVTSQPLDQIVGNSPEIVAFKSHLATTARTALPVLLTGEPGTGKTVAARVLHELSGRPGPFVEVNLASLADGLAPSALFGYTRGAFTGAVSSSKGLLESAEDGTIYLDELENSSPIVQGLLLEFVEKQTLRPVGGTKPRKVDVRVVASLTTVDPRAASVRTDLYYRLAAIHLALPTLRSRPEDIPLLVRHFLAQKGRPHSVSPEAMDELRRYSFPGNIRELDTIISRAAIFAHNEEIRPQDIQFLRLDDPALPGSEESTIVALRRELAYLRSEHENLQRASIRAAPIWEGRTFDVEGDYCFVLMPFAESHDIQRVYFDHVKLVVERRCNLRCERADDIHGISGVMQSVWESINRSRLVIAEMTGRNPNVFYELGIAHTLGKPVVMITQAMDFVPSDLKHLRCIVYSYKPALIEKFQDDLEKTIRRVLDSTYALPAARLRQE